MRLSLKRRLLAQSMFLAFCSFGAVGFASAPQTISPKTVVVHLGQRQQFTSAGATKWTASAGGITAAGGYQAPAAMPKSDLVTIAATGPGGTATAKVTLVGGPLPAISPAQVKLNLGKKQQFTSAGATSWTAKYGTITSEGLYTAPAAWAGNGEDLITVYGSHGSTSETVYFLPPKPTITGIPSGLAVPQGIFHLAVSGTGLIPQSSVQINGISQSTVYSGGLLYATGYIGKTGPATVRIANGSFYSGEISVYIGVKKPLVSASAARRFLEQAAFGPSPEDIEAVQTLGFSGWLKQQFNAPKCASYSGVSGGNGGMPQRFLAQAVSCPDQLRQRVAFALSQIFVTSLDTLGSNMNMITYQDMLLADSFTSYRTIMTDVTLSPAMGEYLNMANNARANPATGSVANENYARELMQLFTIGTSMLNPDGTVQYDSNNIPIPTYSQFTVTEFARVYTGWTYSPGPGKTLTATWGSGPTPYTPMAANVAQHDSGSKQLLNGYVSPAGLTPLEDLKNALDNIFNHPNVGPFVCKQLIQHLVKSNPSPAYVERVAAVFDNNGKDARGDMQAVVTAILMDPEARANDEGGDDQPTDGHLQEPALFIAGMVRAFGGTMNDQNYFAWDLQNQGENIFSPPSVFNYYAPDTGVQGTALMGGEFQIYTPNNAVLRANLVSNLFGQWDNPVATYGPGTTVDLTPYETMGGNPAQLVDALDLTLTHGTMPAEMKSIIQTAIAGETGGNLRRVERGIFLILTSGYYNVWH